MSQEQALITIEEINPAVVFSQDGIEPIIARIEQIGRELVPDLSTGKGRQEIKSLAFKIARSKTLLDDAGKAYVADIKAKVKVVDGARKEARDRLDALKDEVRKPLTEWEEEQARIEADKARAEQVRIEGIKALISEHFGAQRMSDLQGKQSIQIQARISRLRDIPVDAEQYQEFTQDAETAKSELLDAMSALLHSTQQREQEDAARQAEAAKLAEERARLEAMQREQEAARKAEEAKQQEERDRLDAQRRELEEEREAMESEKRREEEARQAAIRAEGEAKAEAERAERERLDLEAREKAEAARQESLRPDKEKLIALMESLNATTLAAAGGISLNTEEAKSLLADAVEKIEQVTTGIVSRCNSL